MVDAIRGKAGFASRFEDEELSRLKGMSGYDYGHIATVIDDGYDPEFVEDYDDMCETREPEEPFEGMIFMSNSQTKDECFRRKLFGLPSSYAQLVKRVRPGMKLFLFEYEQREMYGVFEATTSGAMNIEPKAFKQSGRSFPAQVCVRRLWECYPLSEKDFKDAIYENYRTKKEFNFDLSRAQVLKLLRLFALQKIESQVLEGPDYFEDSQDLLPRSDLQCETVSIGGGLNMSTRDFLYKDFLLREDPHVAKTIYDISDAEQGHASTRGSVYKDLLCDGVFRAGQTVYDISDEDQTLASVSVQEVTNAGNCVRINSESQPFYVRYPNFKENLSNLFDPRDSVINASNVGEEMYDNNTREILIPSNPQNHDILYYGDTEMPHNSVSLDCLPLTLNKPVIEMAKLKGHKKLRQVLVNNSPVNNINDSSFLCTDDFQGGLPSQIMGQPKYPFLQPSHLSSAMSTLRSDNYSLKPSVFSRLKRVPEIDVSHERKHGDPSRQNCPAKLVLHKDRRKLVSHVSDELEVSNKVNENMRDMETDELTVDEGIIINFKRRSQVCKSGKGPTLQVEGKRQPSDEEPKSHKQKRRKLIRPQFDTPKISEINAPTLSIVETSERCKVENQFSVQPENGAHTTIKNMISGADSPAANAQDTPLVNTQSSEVNAFLLSIMETVEKCNVENKILTQPENGAHPLHRNIRSFAETPVVKLQDMHDANTMDVMENISLRPLGCVQNDKNKTCLQCAPVVSRNGSEHTASGIVQTANEDESQGLADLNVNRAFSDYCEKECPSQLVSPSTKILDVGYAGCNSERENGGVVSNVTEHADSQSVQAADEGENQVLANLDMNNTSTEWCRNQCSGQLDFPITKNSDVQNPGCDLEHENSGDLPNVTDHADSGNAQDVDKVELQDLPIVNVNMTSTEQYKI